MTNCAPFVNGCRWGCDHDGSPFLASDIYLEEGAYGLGARRAGQFSPVFLSYLSLWHIAGENYFGIDQSDRVGDPSGGVDARNSCCCGMARSDLDETRWRDHSHSTDAAQCGRARLTHRKR